MLLRQRRSVRALEKSAKAAGAGAEVSPRNSFGGERHSSGAASGRGDGVIADLDYNAGVGSRLSQR